MRTQVVVAGVLAVASIVVWAAIDRQAFDAVLGVGGTSDRNAVPDLVRAKLDNVVSEADRSNPSERPGACEQAEPVAPSRVVVGDTLRLRFFEEPAAARRESAAGDLDLTALVFERLDLSGSYVVDDRGELSIPLLERMGVIGQPLACVERLLADRYYEAFATIASVNASFEKRDPILVSGAVRSPGAYTAMSEMTVRHALALAGAGIGSVSNETFTTLSARRSELDRLSMSIDLEIRRIQAALELTTTVTIEPDVLAELKSMLGERRVASELAALSESVRLQQLKQQNGQSRLQELEVRKDLLRKQQAVIREQVDRKRKHLEQLQALNGKGVAPLYLIHTEELRQIDLERSQFAVDLDLVAAHDAYETARRDLQMDAAAFRDSLTNELRQHIDELNGIEAQRAAVDIQMAGHAQANNEALGSAMGLVVVRRSADRLVKIDADLDTPLVPGDLLEVEVSVRDKSDRIARTSADGTAVN